MLAEIVSVLSTKAGECLGEVAKRELEAGFVTKFIVFGFARNSILGVNVA